MNVLPCGDQAFLVEAGDTATVLGLYAALADPRPDGVTDLVPAAETLLVRFDPARIDPGALVQRIARTEPATEAGTAGTRGGELVTIPVVYDGQDLADVAERTGLAIRDVISVHTAAEYTVAFAGFAPGFGYLTGLDPRLRLPRLETSRTRVPAGSVAIAGDYSGVYPRTSPGGWRLLGRTGIALWDTGRTVPALLRPGVRVRFTAVAGEA
ncbi:5-oxoprolinase subunit B family protein [Amycolatopsis taiwanensis]|uniref:Allophanate hydrolase n=1 Tax=Amycolatopsis taiwanensis TaxID=342230 RepID=A0A9W6QY00_9PSEU|nr:allophanate hydrolase subunit 1 [Amycolatopsis taiwanensis]GLY65624.1 allophanate hydrolase [Amycolatopsis taiwanensis]